MPRIQGFSGIAPRFTPRSLPPNYAITSRNTKLYDNRLRAHRVAKTMPNQLPSGTIERIYFLNLVDRGAWVFFPEYTDVVRGFLPQDERFFFIEGGVLKYSEYDLITGPTFTSLPLGIAFPTIAPTIVVGAGGNPALPPEARAYTYTYVTAAGEESSNSPPSTVVSLQPGAGVVISGFGSPPANATKIRIYRTLTGDTKTAFFFVAEIAVGSPNYTDILTGLQLGEVLQSQDYFPPPAGLQGLAAMGNGFMAAFKGNELWFSEPNQPHAWPLKYRKVVDYPIVAIESFGATYGSDMANTLCVGTTGHPFLARGNLPEEIVVSKIPDPQPCVSARSMVNAESGVLYASPDGLMRVGQGGAGIVTRQVFERDEWQALNPTTMHGHIYDGRYFGWFDSNGVDQAFIFDYNDRSTGVDPKDRLSTLDIVSPAAHSDPEIQLHYVAVEGGQNVLKKWEAGSANMVYRWKSKTFVAAGNMTYAAAKVVNDNRTFTKAELDAREAFRAFVGTIGTDIIDGDEIGESEDRLTQFIFANPQYVPYVSALLALTAEPITFRLYCEGRLRFERQVLHSEPFRLPSQQRGIEWEVEVEGSTPIREIHFETSIHDLVQGGGEQ